MFFHFYGGLFHLVISFIASFTFKITRSCRTAHCPFDCLVGVLTDYVLSVCSFPTTYANETLSLLILKPTQAWARIEHPLWADFARSREELTGGSGHRYLLHCLWSLGYYFPLGSCLSSSFN